MNAEEEACGSGPSRSPALDNQTTGYNFTIMRACGHKETVTLHGKQARRNEQRLQARAEMCEECNVKLRSKLAEASPVLKRLIEEVRCEDPANPHTYNRSHNRHNRS